MKPEERALKSKAELVTQCIKSMTDDSKELFVAWQNGDLRRVKSLVKTFNTHLTLIEDVVKEQLWQHLDSREE